MQKHTIEHWQTGEINIHNTPSEVFNTSLSQFAEYSISFSFSYSPCLFNLNFSEIIFALLFHFQGWKIIRLPFGGRGVDAYVYSYLYKNFGIVPEEISGAGCPDFLLIRNNKEFKFIEVKFSELSLNKNQVLWSEKNKYDLFVYKLAPVRNHDDTLCTDEQIIEINRLKRI